MACNNITSEHDMEFLLKEWNLNSLIPSFKEHNITVEALGSLILENNYSVLKELVPQIGHQVLLRKYFNQYMMASPSPCKGQNESPKENVEYYDVLSDGNLASATNRPQCSGETDLIVLDLEPTLEDTNKALKFEIPLANNNKIETPPANDNKIEIPPANDNTSDNVVPHSSVDSTFEALKKLRPGVIKRIWSTTVDDLDIHSILQQDCNGEAVLAIYSVKQYLDPKYQNYLVEILISYLISRRDKYGHLNNDCFDKLADKIIEVFPGEEKTSYYVPPIKKSVNKAKVSGVARGKLPDKYKNKIALLKDCGILKKNQNEKNPAENITCVEDEAVLRSITWLKHNSEPLEEVINHWKVTYAMRKSQFYSNSQLTVNEIIAEWPILKFKYGYVLMEKDFEEIYPNATTKLYDNFETFFEKAYNLRINAVRTTAAYSLLADLLEEGNLSEDAKTCIQLQLLSVILPNKSTKLKKWKPSIAESIESLVLQVKTPSDIEKKIEERRNKLKKLGLTLQPLMVVVAPVITEVKAVYVNIDTILYKIETFKRALDICFKSFYVLNAQYPLEAQQVWYLIQNQVYEIEEDIKIPNVLDFIKMLKLQSTRN